MPYSNLQSKDMLYLSVFISHLRNYFALPTYIYDTWVLLWTIVIPQSYKHRTILMVAVHELTVALRWAIIKWL